MSGQPESEGKGGEFDPGSVRRQFAILNRDLAWFRTQPQAKVGRTPPPALPGAGDALPSAA